MAIPSNFPAHWRAAVADGDLAGFTDREDLIAFFTTTHGYGCFQELSEDQRLTVADLRNEPTDAHGEAVCRLHQKEYRAAAQDKRRKAANLDNPRRQTAPMQEQDRTAAGIASWDDVVKRVNAQFGAGKAGE